MAENTRQLTEGPVWRAVLAVSAPMSLGIFAVLSIGLADAYFLGQLGRTELAAVGFIYPVTTAITSLSIGLSAGANAALSQAIGRGDDDQAVRRKALHAVGLGSALALAVGLLVFMFGASIFRLIGASDAVMAEINGYMRWWAPSYVFLVAMMVANAAFRAHGDGLTSAGIMVISALLNIVADPALIFGWGPLPELGTEGAGLATFIARLAAAVVALWWAWRQGMIGWCGSLLEDVGTSVRDIVKVGAPASLSNAINPAGMAAVTAAVATLGEAAVAGFGAATRVQSLAIVALLALSAGIGPVVGQNWGADARDRARRAVRFTFLFCLGYGLAIGAALFLLADLIAGLFAEDSESASYTALYLKIVGWTLGGYGILVTANAAMNARSKAVQSMSLSLARIGLVYIPFAWIGVTLAGYPGILTAAAAANILAVWGALVLCRSTGLLAIETPIIRAPAEKLA
ncbi:MAG: MATE family efflux transporter [Silicimonas sp.]|nr:MATE family efflux transporter [Silicimonas sp.]